MQYAVVYSSKTGNTLAIAREIGKGLPQEACIYQGPPAPEALAAEVLFVGFWTNQGVCDAETADFLKSCFHKKTALFGTAGFGAEKAYFIEVLARTKALLPKNAEYLGGFMCQGKMPEKVKVRYEAAREKEPENPRWQEMLQNFEKAAAHPDDKDIAAAAAFTKDIRKRFT